MKGLAEVVKKKSVSAAKPVQEMDIKDDSIEAKLSEIPNEIIDDVINQLENSNSIDINFVDLCSWFNSNVKNFKDIKKVKVDIQGIDQTKTIIYSEPDPREDDENNRKLQVIINANETKVLNLPGKIFENYLSGFKIIHNEINGKVLKSYIVKTGIYVTHCIVIDDLVIPVEIEQVKKKSDGISYRNADINAITIKLDQPANLENIQIQYKQIQKNVKNLKTVREATSWLLERQVGVSDINHLLKLDELIISLYN